MSEIFHWIEAIHIINSTILFGTGLGTAFQMWFAHRTGDPRVIAAVARNVVCADYIFTAPAAVIQPATGAAMIWIAGFDPSVSWLVASYALYVLAGACWLPVVWLQTRARDLARTASETNAPLPPSYYRCMKIWFALGWPAFIAVLVIFWLMTTKPELW